MSKNCLKLVLLMLGLLAMQGASAKMYRWVDESGRVFFSDQVPQDQIQHKREMLNEKARVVDIVEEAKTKEQIALEKRLQALRKEQEKIIAKQKSHDKVLLSTYRNVEDMRLALAGKMLALDAQRKVAEGNLLRVQQQLDNQHKQAANFERRGQKVPDKLLDEIEASKQQVEAAEQEIQRHLNKKLQAKKAFEADIERFAFLTQPKADAAKLSDKTAEHKAARELGLFICESRLQCERAWRIARRFVDKYSTTPMDIDSDKLIMRAPPVYESDLSLSVSKMTVEQDRQQIFLDIRCRQSTLGIELCASPKVKKIRHSFTGYIASELASQQ